MPVRVRITLLFALVVFIILGFVCIGVYYFSYTARIYNVKTRLTNRAINTARLLSRKEIFDQHLIRQIDSFTTIALKNKAVQAYDVQNRKFYSYSDQPGDTLHITEKILKEAHINSNVYFTEGEKEAIAYHYAHNNTNMIVVSAGEDETGKQSLRDLANILLSGFFVGNIFVLVSGYIFSGRLLKPIKQITDDVAEISAQNLARRIYTGTAKDELFQLSSTLNDLLNRLQESFDLQKRFISNASHELSTPLTSISSQLEVSLQRKREAEEYKKVMESVYQDVQHMSKLTQTLLEFAKASGKSGGLEIALVRLDEILLRLPAEAVKIDPAYSVKLLFENLPEEEDRLLVFGNEVLLLTAIKNIVINACKYSNDHLAVVSLKADEQHLLVLIQDNGVGIPDNELSKIFQPFYRIEEHRTAGGFGLGLSLAERIVKLHKGSIDVQSDPSTGTLFTVRLPAAGFLSSF